MKELRPAALALKLKLEEIESQPDAKGLESAFQTAKQKQVNGIMPITSPFFFAERKRIVELAGKYRLPTIYPQKEYVDEGGLMSYGADLEDQYRKAAHYVDKILKERSLLTCRCSRQRSLNLSLPEGGTNWSDNSARRARTGESSEEAMGKRHEAIGNRKKKSSGA